PLRPIAGLGCAAFESRHRTGAGSLVRGRARRRQPRRHLRAPARRSLSSHLSAMPHAHDTGYKLLFSDKLMVRDLVRGFIDDPWLHQLDFSTLERISGQYVTEDMRQREDDVVW